MIVTVKSYNGGESIVGVNPSLTLKYARQEWGWSLLDLAREIEHIRQKKNLPESSLENIRRQIIECERKNTAGPLWRELLSEVLRKDPEELFGVELYSEVPGSDIRSIPVSQDFINIYNAKLDNVIQLEHMFGSTYVKSTINSDLLLLKSYLSRIPNALREDFSLLLARTSEIAGWVAQELGDFNKADQLTTYAYDYFQYSTGEHRSMTLMCRSNILMDTDPYLSLNLISDAERTIVRTVECYGIKASIYKQKALVHFKMNNINEFKKSILQAQEYALQDSENAKPASYATSSYVASELAQCYISAEKYQDAAAILMENQDLWSPKQQRDQTIYMLRLLLAAISINDYRTAMEIYLNCIHLYKVAPSFRSKMLLKMIMKSLSSYRTVVSLKYVKLLERELNTISRI